MGEGAGVILLETEEHALARGAKIYCELAGYGATCDAFHITAPAPGGPGLQRCMEMALKDAHVQPSEVGYVNAHGTSTQLNDKIETEAIKNVFGEHAKKLKISSIKSMIGHSLGAAGGIEAVVSSFNGVYISSFFFFICLCCCNLEFRCYVQKISNGLCIHSVNLFHHLLYFLLI